MVQVDPVGLDVLLRGLIGVKAKEIIGLGTVLVPLLALPFWIQTGDHGTHPGPLGDIDQVLHFEGHDELQILHLGDEILRKVHCLRDGSEF